MTANRPHEQQWADSLQNRVHSLGRVISLLIIAAGSLVLAGWYLDVIWLKSVLPGSASMKPNTALSFVLAGIALWVRFYSSNTQSAAVAFIGRFSALSVGLIACLTLVEYLFDIDTRIDALFFSALLENEREIYAGRMAFATAAAFCCASIALSLIHSRKTAWVFLAQSAAYANVLIGLIAILGYVYGVDALYRFNTYSSVALHTGMLLTVLGLGIVLVRTDRGLAAMLTSPNSGGFLARRIFPVAVLAPFIIGWLRLQGEYAGYYGVATGVALLTAANVSIFVGLIWFAASALNRHDAERRDMQEVLRQSEQRLRNIFDGLGPNMFVGLLSTDGRVLEANQQALAAAGLKPADVLGKPVEETYWFSYSDTCKQLMRDMVCRAARGEATRCDIQIRALENQYIDLDFSMQPFRDAGGVVSLLVPSAIVITERKRTEDALRDSQLTLQLTLDAAQIGYWELNLDTLTATRSLMHDRIFGYNEPLTWSYDIFLAHVHPDDRRRVDRLFQQGVATKTKWDFECRIFRRDGVMRWIRVHGNVFTNSVGEAVRMLGMVSDISLRKEAQTALQEAKENLEQKVIARTAELHAMQQQLHTKNEELVDKNRRVEEANRLKSEFLANMSHELRTPLNAIIGFSELMHDGKVGPIVDTHKEYLGDVLNSAQHLLHLINDVLDLAKVESGKMEFHYAQMDLHKLISEVCETLRTLMVRTRTDVRIEIGHDLEQVWVDALKLKQVLYNFLSNAMKFSHDGGEILVRARRDGVDAYRIEVIDNGVGIRMEDIAQLFTEFHQLDSSASKKYQGTGLGLALTRRIIEAQGGRVGVESVRDEGSLFYARLPLHLPAHAETFTQSMSGV